MKIPSIKLAFPPPPPPPSMPAKKGMNKGLLAVVLIVIIVVATVVPLFALNIIKLGGPSPSPSVTPTSPPIHTPSTGITSIPSGSTTTPTPTPFGAPTTVSYGVLIGTVIDTTGSPLSEVKVSIGGKTGSTNNQGWFSVSNIAPGSYQIAKFSKTGYATTYQVTNIAQGESSFVTPAMRPVDKTATFDAAQGAKITNAADGSYVQIDANALMTRLGAFFTGMASVYLTSFDPTNVNDASAFPGEYMGQAANSTVAPLKSFGFMDVAITDSNGEELQLASGKSASISIQVPSLMQSDAAAMGTCPLWYFDSSTGLWLEQGQGTYDASSGCFVGSVSHFSTWNFDVMYPRAFISGRVVDSNGNPVQGAQVNCWGIGWSNQRWNSGETVTNPNGAFIKIPVEVGVTFSYQASKGGHKSSVLKAGPLTQNEEYNVGDIILDAPLIQITLTWGENPRDLDSHLAAKPTSGSTFHVYWEDKGSLTSSPYANLDTDERYSFGPEVVSISKLQPGTYRYSVRHYAGDGQISTSNAEVNIVIPGVGIYKYTPPGTQATGTDIWRVFDLVIDSTGKVAAVNTINDYVTGEDDSPLLFPP
jgi:hypothetical protein